MDGADPPELLRPAEVADLFRVQVKTVVRWANEGRLRSVRTLGGHRRFYADEVRALLAVPDVVADDDDASR